MQQARFGNSKRVRRVLKRRPGSSTEAQTVIVIMEPQSSSNTVNDAAGPSNTQQRRIKRRQNPANRLKHANDEQFLTDEQARAVPLPPDSERMVRADTIFNHTIIAPASIIRQHIQYDLSQGIGRVNKWRFLKPEEATC